jgi:predicted DNA-binding transcriptional regulator AlpA
LREAAQILGKSPSTIKRLIKSDPDFPRPFSILGTPNNFISRDIRRYVLRKAGHPVDAE